MWSIPQRFRFQKFPWVTMEFFPLLLGLCWDHTDGLLDLFVTDLKDQTAKVRLEGALSTDGAMGIPVQCRGLDRMAFEGPSQLKQFSDSPLPSGTQLVPQPLLARGKGRTRMAPSPSKADRRAPHPPSSSAVVYCLQSVS